MQRSTQQSVGELTTLRSYAKWRILNDMLDCVKKHAVCNRDYLILIMDSSALKVFSSCCKLFDVYRAGLYHIERLEKKRKKYPRTDAIYFISPTKDSIEYLLNDFRKEPKNEDPKAIKIKDRKPQYGGIHLCFTSRVSEELLQTLLNN